MPGWTVVSLGRIIALLSAVGPRQRLQTRPPASSLPQRQLASMQASLLTWSVPKGDIESAGGWGQPGRAACACRGRGHSRAAASATAPAAPTAASLARALAGQAS